MASQYQRHQLYTVKVSNSLKLLTYLLEVGGVGGGSQKVPELLTFRSEVSISSTALLSSSCSIILSVMSSSCLPISFKVASSAET